MTQWTAFFRDGIRQLPIVELIMNGEVEAAIRMGYRLSNSNLLSSDEYIRVRIALVRLHLLFGSHEVAEELIQELKRLYAKSCRKRARWLVALDAAVFESCRHRPGRAAELTLPFLREIPPEDLMVEGLLILAKSCFDLGDAAACKKIMNDVYIRHHRDSFNETLIRAAYIDLMGKSDGLSNASSKELGLGHVLNVHLRWRINLGKNDISPKEISLHHSEYKEFCKKLNATLWLENSCVSLCQKLLDASQSDLASKALNSLNKERDLYAQHPLRAALVRCRARIHFLNQQYSEAYNWLNKYLGEWDIWTQCNNFDTSQIYVDSVHTGSFGAGLASQLPVRYRVLIPFIFKSVNDRDIGVREMAEYLNLTERALQVTCRTHLGITPLQLLNQIRQHCIPGLPVKNRRINKPESVTPPRPEFIPTEFINSSRNIP